MAKGTQVQPFYVSVLLHRDGNAWVAQCLEKDLAVQGPSVEEAKNRFLRTLSAQIQDDLLDGREPLSGLPQAPASYFDKLGCMKASGPELPVYVPAPPKAKSHQRQLPTLHGVSARFLEAA
jgi:hypothetical protein